MRNASNPAARKTHQILVRAQTGFAHGDAFVGECPRSIPSDVSTRTSSVRRSRLFTPRMRAPAANALVNSSSRVHFDERLHAQFAAEREQFAEQRIIESGHNQQEGIGVRGPCFPYLPGIDDEILAQHGQSDRRARVAHVFQIALKKFLLGQHRERRRSRRR